MSGKRLQLKYPAMINTRRRGEGRWKESGVCMPVNESTSPFLFFFYTIIHESCCPNGPSSSPILLCNARVTHNIFIYEFCALAPLFLPFPLLIYFLMQDSLSTFLAKNSRPLLRSTHRSLFFFYSITLSKTRE